MERFPVLALVLRYGTIGSAALGVLVALLVGGLAYATLSWLAPLIGIVLGGLVFVLGKSYVEIVTLITEMLVPR
jgi:hypothetical protein